jgi:hypothetical protein
MDIRRKGEIATIITLVTFFVIGIASIVSSIALKKPQTTQTKAQAGCDPAWYCAGECLTDQAARDSFAGVYGDAGAALGWRQEKAKNCGITEDQCSSVTVCNKNAAAAATATPAPSSSGSADLVAACKCTTNGKAAGDCPVNPCGPIPQKESAPNDNPSCSNWGQWSDRCAGIGENCPTDAGATYTYWCDGKDWRFQYSNCVTWCKVDYLKNPPSSKDSLCMNKSIGDFITDEFEKSGRSIPRGSEKGTDPNINVPEKFKYVSCDGNVGVWVDIAPFCDQFGQIGWAPGRTSAKTCIPPDINVTKIPSGKFWLTANVEVKKEEKGIKFDTTVVFNSTDCDGDITLYKNGGLQAGPNRWRRPGDYSGGTFIFEYYPQWTGSTTIGAGGKETASYKGRVDNCPRSKVTLEDTVNCEFGVSPYGIPWVRGEGCALKNFSDVQKITPATTPIVKKQPTWAPPPPPKLNTTPIIFKPRTQTTPITTTTTPTGKKDGTEGATCGGELGGCKDGLECKQIPLGYGYGICEKSTSTTSSSSITPATEATQTNRCPDNGKDVSCQISCGAGFAEVDRPCITIWDKCCVKKNTTQNQALLTPLPTKTETRTFEFDLGPGSTGQAYSIWAAKNMQICDYFGTTFGVLNDVRNCKVPPEINQKQNEDKYIITYEVKPNQRQMLCEMGLFGIPTQCVPIN